MESPTTSAERCTSQHSKRSSLHPIERCSYQNTITGMRDFSYAVKDLNLCWHTLFTSGFIKPTVRVHCDASSPSPVTNNISDIYTAPEARKQKDKPKTTNTGVNKPAITTVPKTFGFKYNTLPSELAAAQATSSPQSKSLEERCNEAPNIATDKITGKRWQKSRAARAADAFCDTNSVPASKIESILTWEKHTAGTVAALVTIAQAAQAPTPNAQSLIPCKPT